MKSVCRTIAAGVIALVALMGILLIVQGVSQEKQTRPPILFENGEGASTL